MPKLKAPTRMKLTEIVTEIIVREKDRARHGYDPRKETIGNNGKRLGVLYIEFNKRAEKYERCYTCK